MKLHTCFITHNRLELTKVAISSYLETITIPFSAIVVDNDSTDGTAEWIKDNIEQFRKQGTFDFFSLGENRYPGFACNFGWEYAAGDTTHLHRADNDMRFLSGWCDEVKRRFGRKPRLGQLGLRTATEERHCDWNTGGNCIIRADLFFKHGLRYDERPWPKFPPGHSEDTYFSPAVRQLGWQWGRVHKPCLENLSTNDWDDPYYQKSFGDRRIKRGSLLTDRESRLPRQTRSRRPPHRA